MDNEQHTPETLTLEAKIEALLFFKGEPEKIKNLVKTLSAKEDEVKTALTNLGNQLQGRGITLVTSETEAELRTTGAASALIEAIRKQELSKDLGKAGAETLAIVLYNAPVARSDIDYIRGVNSSFILRNLMVRGLIERIPKPGDSRSFVYKPTLELLSHLGVSDIESLPDYHVVQAELRTFADGQRDGTDGDTGKQSGSVAAATTRDDAGTSGRDRPREHDTLRRPAGEPGGTPGSDQPTE